MAMTVLTTIPIPELDVDMEDDCSSWLSSTPLDPAEESPEGLHKRNSVSATARPPSSSSESSDGHRSRLKPVRRPIAVGR